MKAKLPNTLVMSLLAILVGVCAAGVRAADYLSPVSVVSSPDGKTLYIAEQTANQIAVFDIASGKVSGVIAVAQRPMGIAVAPAGDRLYVTSAAAQGKVQAVDLSQNKVAATIDVGHTPNAVAVSPDGKRLYVCNQFDNNVSIIDLAANKQTAAVGVVREPDGIAITPDGKTLFVSNLLPAGAADADYSSAKVSVIDAVAGKLIRNIDLPNGSMSLRGITVSPDGRNAYVAHILARYQLPTTQLERGWINTNAMSIIDVAAQKLVNTVLVDDVDLGGANPYAIACTADGKSILLTHAGTHELSVIDRAALHAKLDKVASGQKVSDASSSADDVPNDLAFLVGLRKRIKLAGNGPRGLAVLGTNAYLAEYFSDTLGVVDFNPDVRPRPKSISLGKETQMSKVRKGEMFFHDADLCFQHWQSCFSCHPDSGRPDALNWDLLNDGLGNPKNTKSLLLAHKTPPAMITGVRPDAETAVRAGIRYIQFAVRPDEDAQAIDEYLKSLTPVPSPYLVNGKLGRSAENGEKLFEKASCVQCHPAPLYTNLEKYNVGTGKNREVDTEFDTPTLIEVWRTAPYLHDGRAVTIREVLTKYNKDDQHGATSSLTEKELDDLVAYVLTR